MCIYMYEAERRRNHAHLGIGRWQAAEGESWNFKVIFSNVYVYFVAAGNVCLHLREVPELPM